MIDVPVGAVLTVRAQQTCTAHPSVDVSIGQVVDKQSDGVPFDVRTVCELIEGLLGMTDSTQGWCRLILARHGETVLNADGRLRGHLDPELDSTGLRQVAALAAALTRYDVRVVRHSPLQRARQTAEAIASAAGVTAQADALLMDRDYGEWAGHRKSDVVGQWGSVDDAPGVEPAAAVLDRALQTLQKYADVPGVVLVAHDAVNQVLLSHLDPAHGAPPRQRTACWNVLEHNPSEGWRVVEVDLVAPADRS